MRPAWWVSACPMKASQALSCSETGIGARVDFDNERERESMNLRQGDRVVLKASPALSWS